MKLNKTGIIGIILFVIAGIVILLAFNKKKLEENKNQRVVLSDFPVQVYTADYQNVSGELTLSGTAIANSEVNFISEVQGRVISVNFDIGRKVSAGTQLAKVDDEIKKANLMTAEANFEKAKKDFDRFKILYDQKSVNEATLDQNKFILKSAEAQYIIAKRMLKDASIVSPISGTVTAKFIEKGSFLNIGTPIANIIDISTMKIRVQISESNIPKIKIGDKVKLKSDIFGDKDFTGTIKFINPKADESHTYATDIAINNPAGEIKPGMFFTAYFDRIISGESLVIPRNALVGSTKEPKVYVVENEIAKLRDIVINRIYGDQMIIGSGIHKGENIVISGQINLRNGSKVKTVK